MMHWFVYKGKNSYSDFGLWISKLPKIVKASGVFYFSNEPGFVYEARILGRVDFDRVGNSLLQANIPFYVKPFNKRLHAGGDTVTVTDLSATLYNPGDVYSRPRISISGSGSNTITIDGQEMSFSGISGTMGLKSGLRTLQRKREKSPLPRQGSARMRLYRARMQSIRTRWM